LVVEIKMKYESCRDTKDSKQTSGQLSFVTNDDK